MASTKISRHLATLQTRLDALEARRQAIRATSVLVRRLIAAGIDPEKARKAVAKAERQGVGLCLARNRRGLPCIALGSGRGGRCKFHGGASTGPKSEDGKRRALEALARGRLTALANRREKSPAKVASMREKKTRYEVHVVA